MSDPPFYRDKALKRWNEASSQLTTELERLGLPADQVAKLLADLTEQTEAILNQQFEAGFWSQIERQNLVEFIDRLMNRQGTTLPDFDELYRRKDELDRTHHDPRP